MSTWPRYPALFEINTWVWLSDLRKRYGVPLDLGSIPGAEWDQLAALGFDAVWLMGVWERSPAGMAIANRNPELLAGFRLALPDFRPPDNVGSPYCIRRYVVDQRLGGPEGLAIARRKLALRGMRLVLDFVPNHVAPDHPWVASHPDYLIRGHPADAVDDPASYITLRGDIFACGRDPCFPAWPDVLQLNAFDPGLRYAAIDTVYEIAGQCDGVRCDMAMLQLNAVFERTWSLRAGRKPPAEYWERLIAAVKQSYPEFLFIAEAYWDLEWNLQRQGFDFCYDKRLYDRLVHESADTVRLHLFADRAYQDKLLRFIENHDEPRAAAAFTPAKERAAAVLAATLPGARLFHEGQFEGRKFKLPVFLGRRPEEPVDQALRDFYQLLLHEIRRPVFHNGEWKLCECSGWPDNPSYRQILAWTWRHGGERYLIAINLGDQPAQARIHMEWSDLSGAAWQLEDKFSGATYDRCGDELLSQGLYVELPPWGFHFLRVEPRQ